jgi:hypothetical protein
MNHPTYMTSLLFRVTGAAAAVVVSIAIVNNCSMFKFNRHVDRTRAVAPVSNTVISTKDLQQADDA